MGQVWSRAQFKYRLHNSASEVGALALEFLTEFADSHLPADERIVRNFSDSCPGKAAELSDVTNNRATRTIKSSKYGTPATTVAFGSTCRTKTADACVITSASGSQLSKRQARLKLQKASAPSQASTATRGGGSVTAASTVHRAWAFTSCIRCPTHSIDGFLNEN